MKSSFTYDIIKYRLNIHLLKEERCLGWNDFRGSEGDTIVKDETGENYFDFVFACDGDCDGGCCCDVSDIAW